MALHTVSSNSNRHRLLLLPLLLRRLLLGSLLAITLPPAQASDGTAMDVAETLDRLVADVSVRLDSRATEALARIDGTGRRLLALRSYLRSGDRLAERWSWSQQQIEAYEGSAEHRERQAEIDKVRVAFSRANPGYELWINPQVRSLDRQLESWNGNESVTQAADALAIAAMEFVSAPAFPVQDPARARVALETFLQEFRPTPTPTVAAPGLSPHGQMRAVDFQVQQGDRIIAGPTTATIATEWDAAGWSERLDDAVREASHRLVGPLASPREPWHYTYTPEAVAVQ
jgi:hypothetical protein